MPRASGAERTRHMLRVARTSIGGTRSTTGSDTQQRASVNILVISHTYITRVGREKWRELVRLFDVNLRIIVPTVWKDYLFTIRAEDHADDELDVRALPVWFSGKEAAHVYRSGDLGMHSFNPDILHVEEGTDAFSYFQALTYRRLFAPQAKTLFFTWMNFEKSLHFPFTFFERFNLLRSDAAICGNSDAQDILRKKGYDKPIHVMPLLGLDPELFRKRDASALREQLGLRGTVIGFIGRFVPEKGVMHLLEAAAKLNGDVSLLLIGGGELEADLRRRSIELGLADRVRFCISIPHSEVPRHINAMDLLVLPSYTVPHWKEQFGQVLVQAMASEVPVLGSTHAEIPRVIGDAGFTFGERKWEELRAQLQLLIDRPELRDEYASRGRERVLAEYTNTRIAERTMEVYRGLSV
ncbi:MAG: glycosyltransferase family 4 protein [Bacteroidetes bacterium]|nr:glycosyltransferase family 4 protein [Bacteroidota bacterium]